MLTADEPVSQRSRQHTAPGRRSDHSELLQLHVDGAGIQSVTQGNIDSKIFHRRIDKFFNGWRHPVNFVNKKHGTGTSICQIGQQIFGRAKRRSAVI